jgi:hypothetical protein
VSHHDPYSDRQSTRFVLSAAKPSLRLCLTSLIEGVQSVPSLGHR